MSNTKILAGDDEVRRMEMEVDRIFKNLLISKNPLGMLSESVWQPPTDVYETPGDIVISMEIPGIRKEDVNIILVDDVLTVRGRRADSSKDQKQRYHQMEIHYGCFERSVLLPKHIDRERIQDATYSDGFLKIVIPKVARSGGSTCVKVKIKL
ncbi:MAG TPA: Hsp20/alpha crystallin family protein [Planctomycetota bacterium]|nr:Hsp20/alpha crystallin family protein [Planctomycetota bacterium]